MTPNDSPHETHDDARARRRAELPAPGTVHEEAAMLVDLLSQRGWGPSSGMPPAGASAPRAEEGAGHDTNHGQHECTCGGRTPAACKVCPVCQLVAFVQNVNPETIEKVADFVGFAATALRDLATAQRERQAGPDDGEQPDGGGVGEGSSS